MTKPRSPSSVGVLGWVRRRVLPKLAKLCALLGLVILGAWITGRALTDEYRWSQYLWWVPPIWMLASAWVLLVLSAALAFFARRLGGLFLRPVLLIACIGSTGYLVFGVWHMQRALFAKPVPSDALRVVHWNQSAADIDQQAWAGWLFAEQADIVLISNASWGVERQELLDELAPFAPQEKRRWVNYSYRVKGDPAHFWIQDAAMIASRFPLIRTGKVKFGSSKRQKLLTHSSSGLGWVMFIEFDLANHAQGENDQQTQATPKPLVVWFVDLPSNPFASRQRIMRQVRQAIDHWDGTGWAMGKYVWEEQKWTGESFPDPDLIIGDFNTPRGSASLELLAPNMTDAFSAAGFGRARSWVPKARNKYLRQPFKLADWHIDLALVGKNWNPVRDQIEDTSRWGSAEHRMQVLDLRPVFFKIQDNKP